jgi:hypothetical protein
MADYEAKTGTKEKKLSGPEAEAFLVDVRAKYDRAKEREDENIRLAYEDLEFASGHNYSQWPSDQRKKREEKGRPVVQINHLPKFIHQITGDIRQMRPSIKIVPVDSGADEKTADKIGSMVRYIENRSDASAIYFRSADSQVACGIAHWKVVTEYADSSTFNQEIRIAPIEDGVSVLWDPDASLPNKDDAEFCFEPVDMSRDAFESAYPDMQPGEFGDKAWGSASEWETDDHVRVAAYWVKKPTKKMLALYPDGRIDDVTDGDESALLFAQMQGARIEERESKKVCRYLLTWGNILEGPTDWPGRHIPIVPVIGEETRIGRKVIRNGIVRHAKDPQRMVNYFHAAHTETVALQPKAPFMVTETNVAKYQDRWETANTENDPYLIFMPDNLNGGQAPQRISPPVSSQGITDGLLMAVEDLKGVIGIYDAGLGNKSNETSGKAILARQREGDVGSFLYIDNFSRAVSRTGQIIVDLIPHVYDTERLIRIMGEDGKIDALHINKLVGRDEQGQDIYENDLTVGSYDVVATVGPSYTTRREEAKEGMLALLQAVPDIAPVIMDLVAKSQDWPMADDIAKRIRATMPPKILKMEEMEKQGMDPQQIQQALEQEQPPPNPEMIKVQLEAEKAKAEMGLKQADMQFKQQEAAQSGQLEQAKMAQEAQIEQARMEMEFQFRQAEIAQKAEAAQAELQAKIMLEREKIESQERIAMHTARVNAEIRAQEAEMNTVVKDRDSERRSETAKYAVDNKPEPAPKAKK